MTKEGPLCCNTSFSHSKDKPEKPVQQAEDAAYLRRRRIVSLISLIGFVIFSIVFAATIGQKLIEFLADGKAFRAWVEQQGILGPLTLVGIMVLQVVIAIIPGEAVEIGAGYAFGAIPGMLLCLVGAALGSVIIYGLTKQFGIRMVEFRVKRSSP